MHFPRILGVLWCGFAFAGQPQKPDLLSEVERHYSEAQTVNMHVSKTLKMKLLEREKHSEGQLEIKHGGKLRWENKEPNSGKSVIVMDGKVLWLADYPEEEDEKVTVLKALNPKKSQPHAVVAFLLGEGKLSDEFKVVSEKALDKERSKLLLKPKSKDEPIKVLKMTVNKKDKVIEQIDFEDGIGNETGLNFSETVFDAKIADERFEFTVPKNADVTKLN